LAEQATAMVRASLRTDGIGGWLPGVYQEVSAFLAAAGVAPVGPPFARYAFYDHTADVEAGCPVASAVSGHGRVTPSSLPAGPAAPATHYGGYDELTVVYEAVAGWLKEHGYEADGPHWEVYYTDPQAEPARWRTDLVAPYRAG
jgi:effector-binding domain-containing protein